MKSMFELSKNVLSKVSFDSFLFQKELQKFITWLENDKNEMESLHLWCIANYGDVYKDVISKEFNKR